MNIGYWWYNQMYNIAKAHYITTIVESRTVDAKLLQAKEKEWETKSVEELQKECLQMVEISREYLIQRIARDLLYEKDRQAKEALEIRKSDEEEGY